MTQNNRLKVYNGGRESDSSSVRYSSPTDGALRDLARLLQDGLRSPLINHSLRVAVKQPSTLLSFVCRIASIVADERPNSKPMLYHLARPSHTALWTEAKSDTVKTSLTYIHVHRESIQTMQYSCQSPCMCSISMTLCYHHEATSQEIKFYCQQEGDGK